MEIKRLIAPSVLTVILAQSVYWFGFVAVAAIVVALIVGIGALLIHNQEKLLYIPVVMGYKTVLDNPVGYRSPAEYGYPYEDFYVKTRDGEKIHGWHIRRPSPGGAILFCHENAGNIGLRVTNLVQMSQKLNVDVIAFDYRGYGHSSGQPTEAGLMIDTQTVYSEYVLPKVTVPIVVYGRSLGGAVALQFAASSPPRLTGVIAENTFTSIADMIGSVFPFLNFSIVKQRCLRLRWHTHEWIELIKCPLLLLSGDKDEIVPASHMRKLAAICTQKAIPHTFVSFSTGTHNDTWIAGGERYWNTIQAFLTKT